MKLNTQIKTLLLATIAIGLFSCNQGGKNEPVVSPEAEAKPAEMPQQKAVDKGVLVGDWVRTDADYRLQISEVGENEKMKAGYFNPRSINVDKALWTLKGGLLSIYIELKDENYPGSNYTLTYIPERDLLAGKYFQAVEGTTYDVGFIRKK